MSAVASAIISAALCIIAIALALWFVFNVKNAYYRAKEAKASCIAYCRDHNIKWKDI